MIKKKMTGALLGLGAALGMAAVACPAQAEPMAQPSTTVTAQATHGTSIKPQLVPILQSTTGAYAVNNCGPTAVTMSLLAMGTAPEDWPNKAAAVQLVRKDAMQDMSGGVDLAAIQRAYTYYGKKSYVTGISEALAHAKQGHAVIVGGNEATPAFTWHKWLKPGATNVGHYVFVAGYDAKRGYKVLDPASASDANVVHYVSASALEQFSAYYTFPSNVIPS